MANKVTPTIVVFYVDRMLTNNHEVMERYVESVNDLIRIKDLNMVAFFLPTDGEERIECINPTIADDKSQEKINLIINDLEKQFDVNQKNNKKDEH